MAKKNLCAMIEEDLHMKVCEERDKAGMTNSEYVTQLLTEYFDWKENGETNMARKNEKTRTLAFQISEELFQRIRVHLERETRRESGDGAGENSDVVESLSGNGNGRENAETAQDSGQSGEEAKTDTIRADA